MAQIKQLETGWADPGFFAHGSKLRSALRLLWQLFKPPKGHRTLPTKAGWMLILLSLAVGSAAFNTGNNILYLGLALLLGSLLLSGVLSWQNFKGTRWRLQAPGRAQVGSSYSIGIELANEKSFLPTLALRFTVGDGSIVKTDAVHLSKALPPGKCSVIYWPWQPQQWGELFVTLRRIVSEYPFGFLRKTIIDSLKSPIIVWPARAPYELHGSKNTGRTSGNEQRQPGGGA